MALAFDTSTVPVPDRAEAWSAASARVFVPLEPALARGAAFHGRLRAGRLGPLVLCGLEASAHTVRRTPRLAAGTWGEQYKLSLMLSGEALIAQDAREAVLCPGDFAIYDCSRPYVVTAADSIRMLVCVLPHAALARSPERLAGVTATRIPGSDGTAWALAPFLERLAELTFRDEQPRDEHRVVRNVVDLVESLCCTPERAAPHTVARAELLLRVQGYIEAHLGDPGLSPARIAAAHFISKRHLHKLFEAEGGGVSRWIRERRLDCCRRDLGDPAHRDESVARIGLRWGLTDPAHLSRMFRDAYGCTPTEYRRRARLG